MNSGFMWREEVGFLAKKIEAVTYGLLLLQINEIVVTIYMGGFMVSLIGEQ